MKKLPDKRFKYDWSKWDPKKTIKENAKAMSIGYVYARFNAYRKKLSFKKGPVYDSV